MTLYQGFRQVNNIKIKPSNRVIFVHKREKELLLTSPAPDLTVVRKLAEKHPGMIRMTLGQMPAITVKKQKGMQTADFLADLLTEYIQLTAENV